VTITDAAPELSDLLHSLVGSALELEAPRRDFLLALLRTSDEDLLEVVSAAGVVRRRFFANRVKLNYLVNLRSGLCPEDCSYCSQRRGSAADILTYAFVEDHAAFDSIGRGVAAGAKRVCLVASGRGPSAREIERVALIAKTITERFPGVEVCTSLGLLRPGQGEALHDAGVFAYNHNLNTAEERYGDICTTHTYADRVDTVGRATEEGLSPCSGAIFGMGESDEDIVNLALDLRRLRPDSVPVNFLMPFEGTPLAGVWELTPQRCLRILALMRFVFPDAEVRVAAGRELHLRSLQPLALHIANSIFLGDYLTSEGQPSRADLDMIEDSGFVVEGHEPAAGADSHPPVALRRRGPGTEAPPNA